MDALLFDGPLEPPVRRVRWTRAVQIVPSRYPPVDPYERIAPAEDIAALHEIESLTNDRLRDEAGLLALVPSEERVRGPGASYIMAPFTHPSPGGSRFGDGTYGVLYAARERATAVAETRHHRARFLAATVEAPMEIEMRVLEMSLQAGLHDLRGLRDALPAVYHPDDYEASQRLGRRLRERGSWGVVYESVRRAGGQCAAVFRPRACSECRQAEHLLYLWNGREIAEVYEKWLYWP